MSRPKGTRGPKGRRQREYEHFARKKRERKYVHKTIGRPKERKPKGEQ